MGRHENAVKAAVADAGTRLGTFDQPLVELCRTLAAQMDQAGPDPSTRLSAAYLSGLKDLRRAWAAATPPTAGNGRLAQLRAVHAYRGPTAR